MSQRTVRGLLGVGRAPILAFLAGVGFFLPAGRSSSATADPPSTLGPSPELPAVLLPATGSAGLAGQVEVERAGPSGSGAARRTAAHAKPLPTPSRLRGVPAPRGDALARLARAGRLSAPSTAPPTVPS